MADSGIPVVFITAHDEISIRQQALAAGVAAYLRKPFNDEVFIKAVRTAINWSQGVTNSKKRTQQSRIRHWTKVQ